MARARRRGLDIDLWPGFVDALSSMLLVMIFLLALFALTQATSIRMPLLSSGPLAPAGQEEVSAQVAPKPDLSSERQAVALKAPEKPKVEPARIIRVEPPVVDQSASLAQARQDLARIQAELAQVEAERDAYQKAAQSSQAELARLQQQAARLQQASVKPEANKGSAPKGLGSDFVIWINNGSGD